MEVAGRVETPHIHSAGGIMVLFVRTCIPNIGFRMLRLQIASFCMNYNRKNAQRMSMRMLFAI